MTYGRAVSYLLALALALTGCAIRDRCIQDPCGCLPPGSCVTPAPTPTPCPGQPGGVPCPEGQETQYQSTHGNSTCWCGTPVPPYVTPTPSSTPTPQPTATPAPPPPGCIDAANAPETPVSLAQAGGCRRWREPVEFEGEFANPSGLPLCAVKSEDRREGKRTSWLLGYGLGRQSSNFELENACGGWLQHHTRLGYYTDALGRRFKPDCSIYENEEDGPRSPYTVGGYSSPQVCPTPTVPTPGPTVGPTPAPIAGQCEDRAMDFINGCDSLRYPKRLDDGRIRGQCDSTERIGCRLPGGEYYRNACDVPHWTGDSESARKTRVLCDHNGEPRDWDAHDGVRLEVLEGSVEMERDEANPFQWWLTAPEGTRAVIRACPASIPILTSDGRTLPVRGDGCGTGKPVKFEVR